jgi:hypothetical protein
MLIFGPRLPTPRGGSALLFGAIICLVVSMAVVTFLGTALRGERWTEQQALERRLELAADSGINLAMATLWSEFQAEYQGRRRAHWDFKAFLDGEEIGDQSLAANPVRIDMRKRAPLPGRGEKQPRLAGVDFERLELTRFDLPTGVRLEFSAATSAGLDLENARRIERGLSKAFTIEAEPWDGLDYALLANNINCLMCHTQVDNAQRFYALDPADGGYQRVKVGSLESLQLRESPESWIAGTLYLAGLGLDEGGHPINNWSNLEFKSRAFGTNGEISLDHWGAMQPMDLDPGDPSSPLAMQNLYLNYNQDPERQVDGYLPESFPSPFPDDGGFDPTTGQPVDADRGNRRLDASEFEAIASLASGSLSGGSIGVATPGERIDSAEGLAALRAGGTSGLGAVTEGNVVLHGTADNPIRLDGEIAIQGDLIISGYVVGEGALRVSGNVYIPSDIQYLDDHSADGDRVYGTSPDGETNSLAIASGGNISVGDIFRPEWGAGAPITGEAWGGYNFIIDELANFNRMEWMRTQPTLPGVTKRVQVGSQEVQEERYNWESYQVQELEPIMEYQGGQNMGEYGNQGGSWVQVGTRPVTRTRRRKVGAPWYETVVKPIYQNVTPQHTNPHYRGPDYVARYYNFTAGSTVPIFNKNGHFDATTSTWISADRAADWGTRDLTHADPDNPKDPILYPASGPDPVVSTLTASGGWLSDKLLQGLLSSEQAARDGSTFMIDATLYSNNSIFGIVPSMGAPGLNGRLQINGSVVAADVGLLAPSGVQLNFDDRSRQRLDITADTEVTIRQQVRLPGN